MAIVTRARDHYVARFEGHERRAARGPSWLRALRREAIARFAGAGFPTTGDEDWRYTNLAPLAEVPFEPTSLGHAASLPAEAAERLAVGDRDWTRVVFVDGRYSPRHSSTRHPAPGVRISTLAEAIADDGTLLERRLGRRATWESNVFAALNTAFLDEEVFLCLRFDASAAARVELLFLATAPGALAQPRVLILADAPSRATVLERYVALTGEAHFTNAVTEIAAGPAAVVDHYVVQEQGAAAFHVSTLHADLGRDSALTTCGVTFGGRLSRATLAVELREEGARADLSGLYVIDGAQHVDHHVTVDHAAGHGTSRQLYKGVLDGSSRAVFDGRIVVRPGARKTDASQTNKHLLLSDGVEVDSKPRLEIFADDVKCTHGAAEGQPAPEALFYLRSRGLGEAAARALLTHGFAREVVDRIAPDALRAYVDRALAARLEPIVP